MQDRYAGDIGDYVKLAILRALMPGRQLGILWWLYPDEGHNSDGRHVGYLDQPEHWRPYDPELFDHLRTMVRAGERRVEMLQSAAILPGATYCNDVIPTMGRSPDRAVDRHRWFGGAKAMVSDCDLVFVDPDNGFETKGFKPGAAKAGKSVSLKELQALSAPGRTLVVYHHQTRMAGGHHYELAHWGERLHGNGFATVDALRSSAYSARAFFLLDATAELQARARKFAAAWGPQRLTWHPGLASPN